MTVCKSAVLLHYINYNSAMLFFLFFFNGVWPLFNKRLLTYLLTYIEAQKIEGLVWLLNLNMSICWLQKNWKPLTDVWTNQMTYILPLQSDRLSRRRVTLDMVDSAHILTNSSCWTQNSPRAPAYRRSGNCNNNTTHDTRIVRRPVCS